MKKSLLAAALVLAATSAWAFDANTLNPAGSVSSYTKTEYTVTSKFGDYYRSPSVKSVHVYDATGLELESASYNSKDVLIDKITYSYDISRNLTSTTYTDASNAVIWQTADEYNSEGKLISESEFDGSKNLVGKTIYKYEDGKVTESYYDSEGKLLSRVIYKVDSSEKVTEACYYFADGSLNSKILYSYLDNGVVSQIETYNANSVLTEKTVYRYSSGTAISEIQHFTGAGVLFEREIYKTDTKGNPTSINIYSVGEKFGAVANELQGIITYAYKYN